MKLNNGLKGEKFKRLQPKLPQTPVNNECLNQEKNPVETSASLKSNQNSVAEVQELNVTALKRESKTG